MLRHKRAKGGKIAEISQLKRKRNAALGWLHKCPLFTQHIKNMVYRFNSKTWSISRKRRSPSCSSWCNVRHPTYLGDKSKAEARRGWIQSNQSTNQVASQKKYQFAFLARRASKRSSHNRSFSDFWLHWWPNGGTKTIKSVFCKMEKNE